MVKPKDKPLWRITCRRNGKTMVGSVVIRNQYHTVLHTDDGKTWIWLTKMCDFQKVIDNE